MKAFSIGIVTAILALAMGPASATAAGDDCGSYKDADKLTATGATCAEAKQVAKQWLKLCNDEGECTVNPKGSDEEFICQGKRKGSKANITCKGRDTGNKVKFKAPV
jgi:hypothetical protein